MMIAITKNEEFVLKQIEIFDSEYDDGIPISILRNELDFHEYELIQIFEELQKKGLISYDNDKVHFSENEKEISTVNSKKDLKELELNIKEKEAYSLIKELVNEDNVISKYSLEGHLLYGGLKLSHFRMYHIILSLQNKELLKLIDLDDGQYYKVL